LSCSTSGYGRALRQPELNDQKQSEHTACSQCYSLQKIEKNYTEGHSDILPLSARDGDITTVLVPLGGKFPISRFLPGQYLRC